PDGHGLALGIADRLLVLPAAEERTEERQPDHGGRRVVFPLALAAVRHHARLHERPQRVAQSALRGAGDADAHPPPVPVQLLELESLWDLLAGEQLLKIRALAEGRGREGQEE